MPLFEQAAQHSQRRVYDQSYHRHGQSDPFDEAGATAHYPPDLELEPRHLDISLGVDITEETASGIVKTTVQARCQGADTLVLDAVNFLDISVYDSEERPLQWRYDQQKLVIHWEDAFSAGEERQVVVSYRVVKPTAGLYFSKPDADYPNKAWYAATDHETERARYWLPCIDLPNVRTTLDIHLRADAHFTALANGAWVEEHPHNDGSKTTHWRLDELTPSYLICFALGDLVRADDDIFIDTLNHNRAIPVAYFCSPQHSADDLMRTFGRTKPMLMWMTRKFNMAFPFAKYYQFALPGISGAMENISLVSWDEKYVQNATLAQELGWQIDSVNVHEMAHSYFGDAVVCRDFAHAWLKESWATYVEQLWREDNYTLDEALYLYYQNAQSYFTEADEQYSRPLVNRRFRSSWDMYDCHLYEGGACRLHTLRHLLGDEIFWAATSDYLKRFNGKVVETDDFRRVFEEHSGRSLGRFFDQWFYTAGYPDLKIKFNYDHKRKQGVFEIEQSQISRNVPAFFLQSEFSWTIDNEEVRWPVTLEQARHVLVVPMPGEPQLLRFDPECKVLHKLDFNPGEAILRRQLRQSPDVIGRILAGYELVKTGSRDNILAVVAAYASEPFWGVRREFANALGKANAEAALAGLLQLLANERDPLALAALIRAAGAYRDARLVELLSQRINAGLPELARAAAYEALGRQRQRAPFELLKQAASKDSFNGFAQQGALRGLAATQRSEALEPLLEAARYGTLSLYARPAVPTALAEIGKSQEKGGQERIAETLVDLLRDRQERMARSAANALGELRATQALPALEAYAHTLDIRQRVEVERVIAQIKSADKSDGSALKKQIEELSEKVRRLEDQVQKLLALNPPS